MRERERERVWLKGDVKGRSSKHDRKQCGQALVNQLGLEIYTDFISCMMCSILIGLTWPMSEGMRIK